MAGSVTPVPGAADDEIDGRTARRDRNLVAVLDAVLALFAEGNLGPTPEVVAARSGVSLRSVYRYFSDPEDLVRAAIERQLERVTPLFHIDALGEGSLEDRIDRFVAARLGLYEAIAPSARASRLAASRNEIIRERIELTQRTLREQFERHFRDELTPLDSRQRRSVVASADALCQLESLDYYRVHRRFSTRITADILTFALTRLLTS